MQRIVLLIALAAASILTTSAQDHLDAFVRQYLELNKAGVIYVKKTDKKTKKVIRQKYVLQWSDSSYMPTLRQAMAKDRSSSVSWQEVDGRVIRARFRTEDSTDSYTIISDPEEGTWMLVRVMESDDD